MMSLSSLFAPAAGSLTCWLLQYRCRPLLEVRLQLRAVLLMDCLRHAPLSASSNRGSSLSIPPLVPAGAENIYPSVATAIALGEHRLIEIFQGFIEGFIEPFYRIATLSNPPVLLAIISTTATGWCCTCRPDLDAPLPDLVLPLPDLVLPLLDLVLPLLDLVLPPPGLEPLLVGDGIEQAHRLKIAAISRPRSICLCGPAVRFSAGFFISHYIHRYFYVSLCLVA